jgi:hypothetical protein
MKVHHYKVVHNFDGSTYHNEWNSHKERNAQLINKNPGKHRYNLTNQENTTSAKATNELSQHTTASHPYA